MKKYLIEFIINNITNHPSGTSLLQLKPRKEKLPPMLPGQFVNVLVNNCDGVFLRRPISICDVDYESDLLTLYIKSVGKGSKHLCELNTGDILNILLPLGNGFINEEKPLPSRPLLIGGGVGMAPMVYLGRYLKRNEIEPTFLLGGAGRGDLPLLDIFNEISETHVTAVDGSIGVKGFVTDHDVIRSSEFDHIYCCGPTPMMKAVAKIAHEKRMNCDVSLENHMACGLGACLCCVENTVEGHKCVCTDGPVFDSKELKW